jgi:hypothetical protein
MKYLLQAIGNPAFLGNFEGQQIPCTCWRLMNHYFFLGPNILPNKPPPLDLSDDLLGSGLGGVVCFPAVLFF